MFTTRIKPSFDLYWPLILCILLNQFQLMARYLIFRCFNQASNFPFSTLAGQKWTIQNSHVDQYIKFKSNLFPRYTISTVYDCKQNILIPWLWLVKKPIFTGIVWSHIGLVAVCALSWFRVRSINPQIWSDSLKLNYDCVE